jgi:hypothetical protein
MEEKIDSAIDVWKIASDFFKSDPMNVMIGIITIVGFIITIICFIITILVLIKIQSFNSIYKKGKIMKKYQEEYEKLRKILDQPENIPPDIYIQIGKQNIELYYNIGFCQKRKFKKRFSLINETSDLRYTRLKSFIDDIIITIKKDIL